MNQFNHKLSYLAFATVLGLSACGETLDVANEDTGSTGQTTTIKGVITGFGSIFIDGVEYETDGSSFSLDGVSGTENDLAVGMVVTLQGQVNPDGTTGVAESVTFADELEGIVLANNFPADGSLDVMGQTIHIDSETALDSDIVTITDFASITVGHMLEVSGFSSGDGNVYATRIGVKKAGHEVGDEIEVKGLISVHDELAQTFNIGRLSVDYSAANLDGLTNIIDGLYVEVKSDQPPVDGVLLARKIELEGDGSIDDSGDDGEEREFEGVVTEPGIDGVLTVNGQQLYYDANTQFENGTVDSLVDGVKVKVEGEFDAEGLLYVHELKFRAVGDSEMSGALEAIDLDNNTITLMGQQISFNNMTIMNDERDDNEQTPVRYFGLDDLAVGDWVELHSYRDDVTGDLVATKFERDDEEVGRDHSLEGVVEAGANEGEMFINGVMLDVSALTDFTISIGLEVEAEGYFNGGVFVMSQVEMAD